MEVSVSVEIINSEAASAAVLAAVGKAREMGVKINVAVCDSSGNLCAFLRMPGAFLHSIDIAIDKAYTSSGFMLPTSSWNKILPQGSTLREGIQTRKRFVSFGGGLPIEINGNLIGAIGVSGGTEDEDAECAKAGIEAVKSLT